MRTLSRRRLLRNATLSGTVASLAVSAPHIARAMPAVHWKLVTGFPMSFNIAQTAISSFAQTVSQATDGQFRITVATPQTATERSAVIDEVAAGRIEMCYAASADAWGRDPAFALGTTVPFGLNARMQSAWHYRGGALELLNALYAKHGLYGLPAGNTGTRMGGWFRRKVGSVDDLDGLKVPVDGLAGQVLAKLGLVPTPRDTLQIGAAVARGALDAALVSGPHDDENLGLYKFARYYYYPAWWSGAATLHLFINLERWEGLSKAYQAALRAAAAQANSAVLAGYDVANPAALRRLLRFGVEIIPFQRDVLDAGFEAAHEVLAGYALANANFASIYGSLKAFRAESYLWAQVADNALDSYMMIQQRDQRL